MRSHVTDMDLLQGAGLGNLLQQGTDARVDNAVGNIFTLGKHNHIVAVGPVFHGVVFDLCLPKHLLKMSVGVLLVLDVALLAEIHLDRHLASRILVAVERNVEDQLIADAKYEVVQHRDKAVSPFEMNIQLGQEHSFTTGGVVEVLTVGLLHQRVRVRPVLGAEVAVLLVQRLKEGVSCRESKLVVLLASVEEVEQIKYEECDKA